MRSPVISVVYRLTDQLIDAGEPRVDGGGLRHRAGYTATRRRARGAAQAPFRLGTSGRAEPTRRHLTR